jgi:hypothetical protein
MCCNSLQQKNYYCQCQGNFLNNPLLLSKKRKINILENYLVGLKEQIAEIEESLEELKK